MTLDPAQLRDATAALREANLAFARRYPGERGTRQPVHTLIEGAQHFTSDVARRRGAQALAALDEYAPDTETFGRVFGIGANPLLATIERRVRDKLASEPVEDYRIDFEDGFGVRSDAEEDTHVAEVASEIARGVNERTLPAALGVRIKPLTEELRERSIRSLDQLLATLVKASALPSRWTITVPKVTVVAQVAYFVAVLRALERELGLDDGTLTFDVMIEVPQAILDMTGTSLLPRLIDAGDGRLRGIDFGTYDYTAGLSITASQQRLRHPACDFAKQMIQVAFAGTGIRVADGATALLPVPVHPTPSNDDERSANAARVHAGWSIHYADVRHSLAGGFYQGWDLHAAQLVSRYAAVSSFYLEGVELAGARLETFLTKATNASLVGGMMDEPATGQGLLGFFHRGIAAGAITEEEAMALTSLTADELRERSIIAIMRRRGVSVASYAIER